MLDTTSNIIQIPKDEHEQFQRNELSLNIFPACSSTYQAPDLVFEVEERNFTIPGKDLLVSLLDAEGGENCHLAVFPSDNKYILGRPFLRNFYTIYDYANKRVGLAEAA